MDKSLSNALCFSFALAALLCQSPFWVELLFYRQIGDGAFKALIFSGGLVVLTFGILIIHNIIRFVFWSAKQEGRRKIHA